MKMREIISLIESIAGQCSKFWYNTKTGRSVTGRSSKEHHFNILMAQPEVFDLAPDALDVKIASYDNSLDPAERDADERSRREFAELDIIHSVTMSGWARLGSQTADEDAFIFARSITDAAIAVRWMSKLGMLGETLHVEILDPNESAPQSGAYYEISPAARVKSFVATGRIPVQR